MIDSVGVEIPVSLEAAKMVAAKLGYLRSTERVEEGEISLVWERQDVEFWPSSTRKIVGNVKLHGSHHLDWPALVNFPSFSVPKLVYGHNVAMVYSLQKPLEVFRRLFLRQFDLQGADVAPVNSWAVSRLDLCYGFRIGAENVRLMMRYLKRVEVARKEALTYPHTVLWKGREYSAKFYEKGPEFRKHDAIELINAGRLDVAQKWDSIAMETLRFEVTLRRSALMRFLDRNTVLVAHIDDAFIFDRLRYYVRKVCMDFRNEVWDLEDCVERIAEASQGKNGKAGRLTGFYLLYSSMGAARCREIVGRSQFFANRRELREMGVRLIDMEEELPEDLRGVWLDVPSQYAVNTVDLPYLYDDQDEWREAVGGCS